jgi:prepilin-type N-terminal cleavage/methylation domain-containing protein/prepilin-type processing-associated H-X9-DG protein
MTNLRPSTSSRRAFTLVELLVVIGIIALLISILLPTLQNVRRSANTVKCASNIRTILQGMRLYAANNRDAIPGSGWTTAQFAFQNGRPSTGAFNTSQWNDNNFPEVVQIFDWISPIARTLGIRFPDGPSGADRRDRFRQWTNAEPFVCPENQFLATPFSGGWSPPGVVRSLSYNTPMNFMLRRNAGGAGQGVTLSRPEYNVPSNYNVTVSKVGNASRKIYVADGARWATSAQAPNYDARWNATFGGAFADVGAWSAFSRAWDRGRAPGNTPQDGGANDARVYPFRHGKAIPFAKADSFRMNVGFFDGRVELLGDLEAANPEFWNPKGTTINTSELLPDVRQRYFPGATGEVVVP